MAWIVGERTASVGVAADGAFTYVEHRDRALRLARREDAEAVIRVCERAGLKTYGGELRAVDIGEQA